MARVRSPAYPALSLPAAVEMIRKVHKIQQNTPEPRIVVLQHMGYSKENGRAQKSISALIKYGFLEKQGDEGLRVSDRAISILYPDPDNLAGRDEALLSASREPSLFNEIFQRWPHRPSEESLNAYLINKGFNVNSVDQVTRAFYDTFDLVSELDDSYDSEDTANYEDEDEQMTETLNAEREPALKKRVLERQPTTTGLNVTKPVFDFETVQIQTMIDNQEDLAELISRLEQIKAMLPMKPQD